MSLKLLKPVFGSLKILLLAGLVGALSMAVSFAVVNYLARDAVAAKHADPALIRRANILRDFSNELTTLCNDYAKRIPVDPTRASQNDQLWVEKVFRSELQFLQQRMDETIREDSPESIQLEATAARCAAMARRPGDGATRAAALQEAAKTVAAIEAWIAAEGVDTRLSRLPIVVQFP
jgi:hypothetical protein